MEKNFQSMTEFLNSLGGYNKIDLMNDYLHVRKCHFSNDLIGFFRDKLQECTHSLDNSMSPSVYNDNNNNNGYCVCLDRNNQNREIYSLSSQYKRQLYWIDNNVIKEGSLSEIREINLQHDLDVIHASFIHNAMSNGTKYISEVDISSQQKNQNGHPNDDQKAQGKGNGNNNNQEPRPLNGHNNHNGHNKQFNYVYDEFGIYFDYWKDNRKDYCNAKYPNLKSELLNNALHK